MKLEGAFFGRGGGLVYGVWLASLSFGGGTCFFLVPTKDDV